jgi:hypothetical protein
MSETPTISIELTGETTAQNDGAMRNLADDLQVALTDLKEVRNQLGEPTAELRHAYNVVRDVRDSLMELSAAEPVQQQLKFIGSGQIEINQVE